MTTNIGATEALALFAAHYDYNTISEVARSRGIDLVVDYFGVKLAAVRSELAHAALASFSPHPDLPATLVGLSSCASAGDAAFYHGTLAHGLEFDDSTLNPVGHPSTVILPALFALAEQTGASGKALMQAYHAGLEVHSRLGAAQKGNWSFAGGWLPIGHISLIGAAAACANLLKLDAAHTAHAIGLSVQFCGQLAVNSASLAKPFGAGNSARCGLVAALLASKGATAVDAVIERPGGFADTFFGEKSHDLEGALAKLGNPLQIEEIGIAIKRYPSCYGAHWGNDALMAIMEENKLAANDIRSIELAHPASGAFLDAPDPRNSEEAKFSHQYNLAVTALDVFPGVASFSEERVARQDVRDFLARVKTRVHAPDLPTPAAWEYRVSVETTVGRTISHSVPRPLGHPRRPMSQDDAARKFLNCASAALDGDAAAQLMDLLKSIDSLNDMRPISRLLDRTAQVELAA
ncbi:hypothetical protein C1T17_02440 [Sphingobium sp. SCG-1]|uniref:MmgE/PrpD family protein n=1 Tax=Sphingobium sp. SCG-1 TaxID=2072936 RepID=UPI000CD6C3E5|nr:MmgE/PrpD family protein [Sphingobium sp. SCG-1]AUW57112.1 hypothetical protein C1T17_02440 [Sphingobium sp. SCG-1]